MRRIRSSNAGVWRTRYLGAGWDLAKVRGTPIQYGRRHTHGHRHRRAAVWQLGEVCHPSGTERADFGDRSVGDLFKKRCYQFSVMLNNRRPPLPRRRCPFSLRTLRQVRREILAQPGQAAWQIFDAKVLPLLQEEYHISSTRVRGRTLDELLAKMEGVDAAQALRTLRDYNAASEARCPVQSQCARRQRHRGTGNSQVELGQHDRRRALRSVLPSPAGSRLRSGASRSTLKPKRSTCAIALSAAYTSQVRWPAESSTSTIPAAAGLPMAPCSAASPDAMLRDMQNSSWATATPR